uniref:Uncharacterized protein n=1 Tax=Onchocerca volvulus TaxID=6282 RepID=A0A8R1TIR4_ONCVO
MSESGTTEAISTEEFPKMPKNYNGFHVLPSTITDRFLVLYTIVGMQWCTEDANALLCWQRVKVQQVPTKSIILTAKLEQSNIS